MGRYYYVVGSQVGPSGTTYSACLGIIEGEGRERKKEKEKKQGGYRLDQWWLFMEAVRG
jgi:hypothetical protein